MLYGSITSYIPYKNANGPLYKENLRLNRSKGLKIMQHLIPLVPLPEEKTPVTLSFMMCLAVGGSVFCLFALHFYLILTAQTTIEFHGEFIEYLFTDVLSETNCMKKRFKIHMFVIFLLTTLFLQWNKYTKSKKKNH